MSNTAPELRVAIVGCGRIADAHVEEISKMTGVRIVGVCDREVLMAEQLATRYGLSNHYDDLALLLREQQPDVVHITTPPQSHLALAEQAFAAGCHVFVEKPIAVDYREAQKLVELAERASRKLTVGYIYLFDPAALALRDAIESGRLGEIVHLESFYGYNLAGPFGAAVVADPNHWVRRLPGQLLHNVIDHLLNKVVTLIPDESPRVTARGWQRRVPDPGEDGTLADELRVLIEGESISAYATFSSHIRPSAHFLRVYGSRATAHVNFASQTLTYDVYPSLPSAIGRLLPPLQEGWQYLRQGGRNLNRFRRSEFQFFAGLQTLLTQFYSCIREGGAPPIPYRDILRVAALMDEIFAQIRPGVSTR